MTTPGAQQGTRTRRNAGVLNRYRPGLSGLPGDQEAMGWAEGGGESQCPPGDSGWRHDQVPALMIPEPGAISKNTSGCGQRHQQMR